MFLHFVHSTSQKTGEFNQPIDPDRATIMHFRHFYSQKTKVGECYDVVRKIVKVCLAFGSGSL